MMISNVLKNSGAVLVWDIRAAAPLYFESFFKKQSTFFVCRE